MAKALKIESTDVNGDKRITMHVEDWGDIRYYVTPERRCVEVYEDDKIVLTVLGVNYVNLINNYYPPAPVINPEPPATPEFQNKADDTGIF